MNRLSKPSLSPKQLLPMLLTWWVLVLVNGCAPGPPALASVSVSPNPSTVLVSGTRAFSAAAKDASGNAVSASFVWASSIPPPAARPAAAHQPLSAPPSPQPLKPSGGIHENHPHLEAKFLVP